VRTDLESASITYSDDQSSPVSAYHERQLSRRPIPDCCSRVGGFNVHAVSGRSKWWQGLSVAESHHRQPPKRSRPGGNTRWRCLD
jgi:hypothetical protein